MFACQHEGVNPDFLVWRKDCGGYFPLAATVSTEAIYQGFLGEFLRAASLFLWPSYSGNP